MCALAQSANIFPEAYELSTEHVHLDSVTDQQLYMGGYATVCPGTYSGPINRTARHQRIAIKQLRTVRWNNQVRAQRFFEILPPLKYHLANLSGNHQCKNAATPECDKITGLCRAK